MNNFIDTQNETLKTNNIINANEVDDKKVFIAYFDILGFKNIVKNKSKEELKRFFENVLVATQSALSDKRTDGYDSFSYITDMSNSKVNCLHISDSILFWTNNDTCEDLHNIIEVCRRLIMKRSVINNLLRGCLTYGHIDYDFFNISLNKSSFHNYSIIGDGVVEAYEIAESLLLTGCAVTKSLYDKAMTCLCNNKICKRSISTKHGTEKKYMLSPFNDNSTNDYIENTIKHLEDDFRFPLKRGNQMPDEVKQKLSNTIDYFRSFQNPNSSQTIVCN